MFTGGTSLTGVGDIVAYLGVGGQKDFESALNSAGQKSDALAQKINMGLTAALVAGAAAMGAMTKISAEFQKQMADVNTLLDGPAEQFGAMNDELLALAQTIPSSMASLTKGLYDLVSAGAPAADAVSALGLAAKAATAGVTGVNVAVNAGMSTINSYGLGMENLTTVYDLQFSTVKKGVLTYEQLASSIGTVLPAARTLNVSLEDMYGSIAFLTKAGQSADMAMTTLSRAFEALVEQKDKLAKFGVTIFDTSGKFRGMEAVVGDLAKALAGMTDEQKLATLATLDFDIEAGRAINTMINNYDGFKQTLDDVADSSGAMETAFKKQMDTFSSQASKFKNIIQTAFIKQGTELLLPALQGVLTALNEHPEAIEAVVTSMSTLALTAGGLAAIIKGGMGIKAITALLGPWGVGITAVVTAATALYTINKIQEEAYWKSIDLISDNALELKNLEDKYNTLKGTQNLTKAQQEELDRVTKELSEKYKELGFSVEEADTQMGNLNEKYVANNQIDLLTQVSKLDIEISKLNVDMGLYNQQMDMAQKRDDTLRVKELEVAVGQLDKKKQSLITTQDKLRKEFDELTNTLLNKATPTIDDIGKNIEKTNKKSEQWNLTTNKQSKEIQKQNPFLVDNSLKIIELGDKISNTAAVQEYLREQTEKTNKEWADYAEFINDLIQDLPGLSTEVKNIGSSLANMVTSGFDPMTTALSIANIGLELFGGKNEYVEITVDDVIESMGEFGQSLIDTKTLVEELGNSFDSDLISSLQSGIDKALAEIAGISTEMQKMPPQLQDIIKQQIGVLEKYIEDSQKQIEKYSAAFGAMYDFQNIKESIDGFVNEAIKSFELLGTGFDYSGIIDLLNEQITLTKEQLEQLDPTSKAYAELSESILMAQGALAVLNGEYVSIDEYMKQFNELVKEQNTLIEGNKEQLGDNTEKIKENTDMRSEHKKGIEDETGAVEDQVEVVKSLSEMWEEAYKIMFQEYDEFTSQMKEATGILDQIDFFGLNMGETEMDERVGQLIKSMRDYLDTLNPNSQAYAEYKKQLNELIAKFYDLQYGTDELTTSTGNAFNEMENNAEKARQAIVDLQNQIDEKLEIKTELKADFDKLLIEQKSIIDEINSKTGEHEKLQLELEIEMQGVQDQINKLDNILDEVPFKEHILSLMENTGAFGGFYELYEILESITGQTKRLNIEWSDLLDNLFQDYDAFSLDMNKASEALEKLTYFGVDLKGSGVEDEINATIVRMQDFLSTLDPNSQAYKDYKDALDVLIEQYKVMGGVIDRTAAGDVFDQDKIDATNEFQELLERLQGEYQENEIIFNANIQPLLDRLKEIDVEFDKIRDQTIELDLDISKALAEIDRLNKLIAELQNNGFSDKTQNINSINGNFKVNPANSIQRSQEINMNPNINITSTPQIIVHEATPNTWVEVVDTKIQPRINYKNRKLTVNSEPYRI